MEGANSACPTYRLHMTTGDIAQKGASPIIYTNSRTYTNPKIYNYIKRHLLYV